MNRARTPDRRVGAWKPRPFFLFLAWWLMVFSAAAVLPPAGSAPAQEVPPANPNRPVSVPTAEPARPGATVLIYHRFGEEDLPTTNIAADRFEEQLAFLRDNGYRVLALRDLAARLLQGEPLPDRSVVITIDDGYRSVYEVAWPLLRKYGFPFTVFVYVEATDQGRRGYMNWNQIRELRDAGVDFQNHGYGHLHMAERRPGMTDQAYRAWIRADLAVSTRILSQQLGQRPEFFAVPYGEYNQAVIDEARLFGYRAILMQDPGSVGADTDPLAIPREAILGEDWSTMEHFQMVLERVDLPLADLEPVTAVRGEIPPRFSARLLYPERYRPGTLGIYVTELGWRQAVVEDGRVIVANDQPLTRPINRVAVSGREKESNRTAIRYWLLVAEEPVESMDGIHFGSGGMTMK